MIITLVAAATALVAAATGYLVARRGGPSNASKAGSRGALPPGKRAAASGRSSAGSSAKGSAKGSKGKPAAGADPGASTPAELPLALGDVITSGLEERWLAGALIAREKGRIVSALFFAPEGAATHAVAVFELPRTEIFWLDPVSVDVPSEPPATLEIGTAMLKRLGRIPVAIERAGQGAPHVGSHVLWATYEGSGREVAIVLSSEGRAQAWMGRRLDASEYERLGASGPDD